MKVVLTTYVDANLGVEIDKEARDLKISRSDYIGRIVADHGARQRARTQIKREHLDACLAKK